MNPQTVLQSGSLDLAGDLLFSFPGRFPVAIVTEERCAQHHTVAHNGLNVLESNESFFEQGQGPRTAPRISVDGHG